MTIYIGNIAYNVTAEDLQALLEEYSKVKKLTVPSDKELGRIKGYAFVELEDEDKEEDAINGLNNTQHMGRNIKVERANSSKSPYQAKV